MRKLAGFGIGAGAYCLMVFPAALTLDAMPHWPAVVAGLGGMGALCAMFMPADATE